MEKPAQVEISTIRRKYQLKNEPATAQDASATTLEITKAEPVESEVEEFGGPKGLEPTRYGDWEAKGRCYDF